MRKAGIWVLYALLAVFLTACGNQGPKPARDFNGPSADSLEQKDHMESEEKGESGPHLSEHSWEVGNIILTDGSVVEAEALAAVDESHVPAVRAFSEVSGGF